MTGLRRRLIVGATAVVAASVFVASAYADDVLDRMKADIARSVGPQTTWDGPTTGPKAAKDKSIVFVSLTQNSSGNADSARGAEEAAKVLGWKFTLMDGKGTATGGADALNQAIALKPDAIILGSVSIENNKALIQQANDAGIVVIGWHATDKPGPVADPKVFTNVGTDPYAIAYTAGEYAVVDSNGTAQAEVISDRQYPIAFSMPSLLVTTIGYWRSPNAPAASCCRRTMHRSARCRSARPASSTRCCSVSDPTSATS